MNIEEALRIANGDPKLVSLVKELDKQGVKELLMVYQEEYDLTDAGVDIDEVWHFQIAEYMPTPFGLHQKIENGIRDEGMYATAQLAVSEYIKRSGHGS